MDTRLQEGQHGLPGDKAFLRHALARLKDLQDQAETHYHGVLARMLASARVEIELLLHETGASTARPDHDEGTTEQPPTEAGPP
jgi:hypothetical protein